jgi:antitoxin CcdA
MLPSLGFPAVQGPQAITGGATKRAVNLTLNDALVSLARHYTTNLSATVEALLLEYVATQQRAKATRQQQANSYSKEWNAVGAAVGSFADEHTTL